MKTQWFLVLFALLLCAGLAFTACGDDDDDDDDDAGDDDDDDSGSDGGIWTDPDTGLMWQRVVNDDDNDRLNLYQAIEFCENLELEGFDDWRVPTIDELRTIIQGCSDTEPGGDCSATDDCVDVGDDVEDCMNDACWGCSEGNGPAEYGCYWSTEFLGTCYYSYWSSTMVDTGYIEELAYHVDFQDAGIAYTSADNDTDDFVRCVRN